jgi:hypothetical protein
VPGAHQQLAHQAEAHQDDAGQEQERPEQQQRAAADRLVEEQFEHREVREQREAEATAREPHQAEQVRRPRSVRVQELDREQVEQDPHGAPQAVLAVAPGARPVVDGDLGQAHPHPRRDGRDEAVHLAIEPDPARDVATHGLERAAVVVERDARRPRDQAVREERRDPLRERVAPRLAPAAHHVEVFALELRHERGDVGRVVLQVAVGGHHHVAARAVEARREGGGLPEVPAQQHDLHPRVARLELEQALARAVGAAVVDQHDLERAAER